MGQEAHLVNMSNRPANRSKPVALELLNSNLNPTGLDRFPVKPVRYTGTGAHRFDRTGRIRKPWSELGSWATLGPFEPESVL